MKNQDAKTKDATIFDSIVAIKTVLSTTRLNKEDRRGLEAAVEILREVSAQDNTSEENIGHIGDLYRFHDSFSRQSEHDLGYNTAIRDVLNILDPLKKRYNQKEGC